MKVAIWIAENEFERRVFDNEPEARRWVADLCETIRARTALWNMMTRE